MLFLGVFQYTSKVLGYSATMDYTSTNSLSWALLRDSSPTTVPSLSCSPWLLHVFKINITWVTLTDPHILLVARDTAFWISGPDSLSVYPGEILPRNFHLNGVCIFLIMDQWSSNQYQWPVKQMFTFSYASYADILLILTDSSSLSWPDITDS